MEKVVLEYKRDKETEGHNVVGRILYVPEDGAEEEEEFNTPDFAWMMMRYAEVLKEHPEAEAWFKRTDRLNFPAAQLDPLTTMSLREKTEETVEQLANPKPVHIDLRPKGKE